MTKQKKTEEVKTPDMEETNESVSETETSVVPDKFKAADGCINTDALIKSYLALEKKLGQRSENNIYGQKPEKAEDYQISIKSEFMKNDPEINQRLFEAGLTNEQVQVVYDIAADKVIPVIENLADTFQTEKELTELQQAFGGPERFNDIARQISQWGEKNLKRSVYEALVSSKDGILTLYKMMSNAREESVLPRSESVSSTITEAGLKKMMQDPKYWKQQDPDLVKRVEDGFKRLYG